jgi:hypothetical protein
LSGAPSFELLDKPYGNFESLKISFQRIVGKRNIAYHMCKEINVKNNISTCP